MAIALGDLLYVDGDLSGGWEAGPPAPPKAFEEIMNTSAKVDRRLYLYGKVDGGVTGLVFTTQQEALSAMDTLTPRVATMFTGQPGQQVSAVALLGEKAVSGVVHFRITNMEVLGLTPKMFPTILFVRDKVTVFIRCSGLTEGELYTYAKKIDLRLHQALSEA